MIVRVQRILDVEPFDDELRRLVKKWAHLERDVLSCDEAMAHIFSVLHQGGYLFFDVDEEEDGLMLRGYFLAVMSGEPGRVLNLLQQYSERQGEERERVYAEMDAILMDEAKAEGAGSVAYVSVRAVKDIHGADRFFERRGWQRAAAVFTLEAVS